MTIRLLQIVGARPQFIKIAPLSRAIATYNSTAAEPVEDCIVHTGQHYDHGMSDVFFEELSIPRPNHNLGIGSASHGEQTGAMLAGIERLLLQEKPRAVIVYGDTNSTIAGALAAVKQHIPVVHIEAGLRSFNRRMPEEINRVMTDHAADLLLAPTQTAVENLNNEGLAKRTRWAGDVMYDAVLFNREIATKRSTILQRLGLEKSGYGVVTLHRAENTDDAELLQSILAALNSIANERLPLVFPMHPRTLAAIRRALPQWNAVAGLKIIEPIGYLDMLQLLSQSRLVFTDSGGLQKEAFFLDKPCITLREETEWVETLATGANRLVGADASRISTAVQEILNATQTRNDCSAFGDGRAAALSLDLILETLFR